MLITHDIFKLSDFKNHGLTELQGDLITVDQGEWQTILDEFPRPGFKDYFTDVMVGLCRLKPEQTYLNFVGDYGEKYLANYTKVGHRIIDILDKALPPN